jgi:hypothetical protein
MRNNHILQMALTMALVIILSAPAAIGQIVYGQPGWGAGNVIYTHWSVDSDSTSATLSQVYVPLSGFVPIQDNFEMQFYVGTESNKLDITTDNQTVSGLTDVRLQANHSFMDDQLLFSGGLNLPTGKRELDPLREQPIIEALSRDFLEFPVRRFGEGFGFNVLASAAKLFGDVRAGASVGYRMVGEYTAYEGTGKYNPGDQFTVDVRTEIPTEQVSYLLGIGLVTYTKDQVEGVDIFQQGRQLNFYGSVNYHAENYGLGGSVSYVARGNNKFYVSSNVLLREQQLFGDEFSIRGHADFKVAEMWDIQPHAHFRSIAASDIEESATVFGVGTDVGREISERVNLGVGLTYYTGSANGGDLDLSGIQLTGGLSASF